MPTNHARISSRSVALLLMVASLSAISLPALAEQHVLNGTHSKEEVKGACDKVGGISNEGAGGQGYGCYNPKNGTMVACNNGGVCTGYTPGRVIPATLRHLLALSPLATTVDAGSPPPSPATGMGQGAYASPPVTVIY